jgi:hypothetical protein
MRLRPRPSSRMVRVAILLSCLAASSVGPSDAPARSRVRGRAVPAAGGEPTGVPFDEPAGAAGGLSAGDDWLG